MLEVFDRLGYDPVKQVDTHLLLRHEERDKGRLRTYSVDGEEIRIFLDRGKPLQVGELLRSQCGKIIRVDGAVETVAIAQCDDWLTFSRACYHLGNRHVKMEIGDRWLRILPDHVLEELLTLLGLAVGHEQTVFVPESGAYAHAHNDY